MSQRCLGEGGIDMKKMKKTDPNLMGLISELKTVARENDAPIWRDVARRLEGPARNWAEVNVSKVSKYAEENDTIVIPGKLLGAGDIDKKVTIATYRASKSAVKKVESAGGKVIGMLELAGSNPKGSGVRIMR